MKIERKKIMNQEINEYIEKFNDEIKNIFCEIRQLVMESSKAIIQEKMWAKLPSYYAGEKFIRIIPFKDHVNIEAYAVLKYKSELTPYKITSKGMLQIYTGEEIPTEIIRKIVIETLV